MDSNMFKPTVGPIIGHTTTNHARIFLRGEANKDTRAFAGIRYRRLGDENWSKGTFAELEKARDMSAVLVLNNLTADTVHEYQAGWFNPIKPVSSVETIQELPLQWPPHPLEPGRTTQGLCHGLLSLSAADRRHCGRTASG
jgi:alkaline phosphatase D